MLTGRIRGWELLSGKVRTLKLPSWPPVDQQDSSMYTACGKGFSNISALLINHHVLGREALMSKSQVTGCDLAVETTSGKCFHFINSKVLTENNLIVFLLFGFCHNHLPASHFWLYNWQLSWATPVLLSVLQNNAAVWKPSKISPPCYMTFGCRSLTQIITK